MSEKFYGKFVEKKGKAKASEQKFVEKQRVQKENSHSKPAPRKNGSPTQKSPITNSSLLITNYQITNYKTTNSLFNTSAISKDSLYLLENFDSIIQSVRPLNSKQMQQLPDNIRALSHQLTDERSSRRLGYMNETVQLSAYVRYYTWWNLVRLTRLFANLPEEAFPAVDKESVCIDLGSGPLTVILALWLARPELRKTKLTWYCVDVSGTGMALGEDLYLATVARTAGEPSPEPWKIIRVKGSFGTSIKQKADFITCANMFNELDQASDMPPEFQTKKYYEQLQTYASAYAKFLLVEPGVPKAARTLSLLRERFIRDKYSVLAPCPHAGECPMNGFKAYTGSQNKWCNFAFSTEGAPARLLKLSEQAKLPKERATLSFVSISGEVSTVVSTSSTTGDNTLCRVTSDQFRLPHNKTGVYACSKFGLTLLEGGDLRSGDLIVVSTGSTTAGGQVKTKTPDLPKDEKSGAVIIRL